MKFENLEKEYLGKQVLNQATITLYRGETHGFLGPNGAGKTTTMRIMAGLLRPQSGRFFLDDEEMSFSEYSQWSKHKVGFLPEKPLLYSEMEVEAFLRFCLGLRGWKGKKITSKVLNTLEELDIMSIKKKMIGQLSKGYLQRVGLAAAVIHGPRLLILDEPFNGLDPLMLSKTRKYLESNKERWTLLFSSHVLKEVEGVSERLTFIKNGRILASDKADYFYKMTDRTLIEGTFMGWKEEYKEALLAKDYIFAINEKKAVVEFEIKSGLENQSSLIKELVEIKAMPLSLKPKTFDLESVFSEVIKR